MRLVPVFYLIRQFPRSSGREKSTIVAKPFRRIAVLSCASISFWAFSGCLVVIRADTPGAHCGFKGSETACGKCLADKCRSTIDKCCSDERCAEGEYSFEKPFMELIDGCASGDSAVCAALSKPDDYSSVAAAKIVSTCMSENCLAACAGSASPHRSCTDRGLRECTCSDEVVSKGGACSLASVGGGPAAICVRGESGCTCASISCSGSSDCTCANDGGPGGFTGCERTTADMLCCLRAVGTAGAFTCECSETSRCSSSSIEVPACSEEAVRAVLSNVTVDKCDN